MAVVAIYVIPTGLGHDIARVRLVALPIALLVAALRRWRPLPLVLVAVGLAATWNVFPLATAWASSTADRSANAKVWPAPVAYLQTHLRPGYRVEAVDTVDHWPALYLARREHPARARLVPAGRPSRRQSPLPPVHSRRSTSPGCADSASRTSS